jgi:hypothetical protein
MKLKSAEHKQFVNAHAGSIGKVHHINSSMNLSMEKRNMMMMMMMMMMINIHIYILTSPRKTNLGRGCPDGLQCYSS